MRHRNSKRYDLLLQDDLQMLLGKYRTHLQHLTNDLRGSSGGSLYIKKSKSNIWFTEYRNGKERGISRDMERVHTLARRKYNEIMAKNLRASYNKMKELSLSLENIGSRYDVDPLLKEYRSLNFDLNRIVFSPKELKWANHQQSKNSFHAESLEHITDAGIIMRSKSERNIGNRLELWMIPYLYEYPLKLGYRTYYPDFTIRKYNGEIIYWEHFGMMDDDAYFRKNMEKLREYRQYGLCDHTNLIVTWEEDLRDMSLVDHIIKTRICN